MMRPVLRRATFLCLCLLAPGLALSLPAAAADTGWKAPREALDQRHVAGVFRIHYTTTGGNAIRGDAAAAATLALRLGEQLERAHRFYSDVMKLTPPLGNPRYPQARAIDVHVIELEGRKGSAGDEPIVYRYRHFDDFTPALTISISNRWTPGNLTPEHEVFHAYQYGYTFFKNAWFLEGMANGMEAVFRARASGTAPLPQDAAALRRLLDQSYGAGSFWNRLMRLCDADCPQAPPETAERRVPHVCGAHFVKRFLEELRTTDKLAARARGIDPRDWPEEEQRSERNNAWLLDSLARSVESRCPVDANAELTTFLGVLQSARGDSR
ncbi:MAG: hypothetical protein Q8O25_03160 [Sulfurisoma sp.]|nr:hypothetical protein [Sulfurisoma sp.]